MKRAYLLFFLLVVCAEAALAQQKILEQSYRPRGQKASIKGFLDEIRLYSGIIIEYSPNHIDEEKPVQLDGTERTLGAVLQKVLQGQRVRLVEKNGKVLLVPSSTPVLVEDHSRPYPVFGFVKVEGSREPLIDVTVLEPATGRATTTNPYGYFNLSLPPGKHTLVFSFVGFTTEAVDVDVQGPMRHDIDLRLKQTAAPAVVVSAGPVQKEGVEKITPDQYAAYTSFLGESDPVRSLYLMPGVKNVPESFNGLLVRGGGANENLFLLDGNPVYNPTHMLGALSVINPTSLKALRLYKSDFPARFDGAVSSVVDVYTRDGDMSRWQGEVNAGFLAGSVSLEGPLVKGRTALMTSLRHSWPTSFVELYQKGLQPDFYDAHLKLTHLAGKKDKLLFNLYKGQDRLRRWDKQLSNLHQWGNLLGAVGWNHVLGARSLIHTSVNMSRYDNLGSFQYTLYDDEEEEEVIQTRSLGSFSAIEHYNVKTQAQIYLSNTLKINTGGKLAHTVVKPFETRIATDIEEDKSSFTSFQALPFQEGSAYGEGEWKLGRLFIRPGLHVSAYQFQDYRYLSLQPRFFASLRVGKRHHLLASYNEMTQYLHLVTNPYLGANSDIWVPSTRLVQPEKSSSYNIGYTYKSPRGLRLSLDAYQKTMSGVTNYAEGKSYFIHARDWERNIETGQGESFGVETLLEQNGEKLSLHAAYTLAWSFRKFKSINEGRKFPYKYDRRHDLNLGISYRFGDQLSASALWSFATGDLVNLPDHIYPDFDQAQQVQTPDDPLESYRFIYHYSGVNQYRTAPYQRLDVAVHYHSKAKKKLRSSLTAGVYDVYGAADQYNYELKGSLKTKRVVLEVKDQLFKITPYLSYTLKF